MDYKFLNRVIDQIVNETTIDYDNEGVNFPFPVHPISNTYPTPVHRSPLTLFLSSPLPFFIFLSFSDHCKDVYGLNLEEVSYVWKEYKDIIKDKIENNG
jgi:hypothetical protein